MRRRIAITGKQSGCCTQVASRFALKGKALCRSSAQVSLPGEATPSVAPYFRKSQYLRLSGRQPLAQAAWGACLAA